MIDDIQANSPDRLLADCDRAGIKPACFRSPSWTVSRDHQLTARSTTNDNPAHDRIGRSEKLLRSGGMFGFSRIISGQNSLCPAKQVKLAVFSVGILKVTVARDRTHDYMQDGVTGPEMRQKTPTHARLPKGASQSRA